MEEEIINRVAQSPLITFNLEELYPQGERKRLDIAPWLHQGIILREKEFRTRVEAHDWTLYANSFTALY